MSSIIEGYNYDIFISYRQKDNKGDRWVSEFVDALKTELESTFKEDISVYFDINPHDGLLETHDVDASLKDKLKCLVFIPIVSRTYCDPKSFAWEHEFRAFINQASQDKFGLKVKVPGGNTASRILPVQIHELNPEDKTTVECELRGCLRGIEFIYKEPGVNRPLMANEDHPDNNLNKTFYRNQINKVANAINEIIEGLKNPDHAGRGISTKVDEERPFKNKKDITKNIAGILLLLGLIVAAYFIVPGLIRPNEHMQKSIAVLPFRLLSDEPDKQYLADGMMEAITLHLSNIKDLRVMPGTSVEQYRGTLKTSHVIGKELDVEYLLEGSFQMFGDNVKLIVRLIKANKESQVWANEYDSKWNDVLSLQSEVARKIASELKVMLTPAELGRIAEGPTKNLEAYQAYLRGRYYAGQPHFSIKDWNLALESFQNAVDIDTTFAFAYGELARANARLIYLRNDISESRLEKADKAAATALRLGSEQPRVQIAIGYYYLWAYRDKDEALKHLEIAEKTLPNDVDILVEKAAIIVTEGRWEENIRLLEKALQLRPHDYSILADLAEAYWFTRRYKESVNASNQSIASSPNSTWTYLYKVFAYWSWKGPCKESREAAKYLERENEWYLFVWFFQEVGEDNFKGAMQIASDTTMGWGINNKMWAIPRCMLDAYVYDYLKKPELAHSRYQEAIGILEKKIAEIPNDPRYHSSLGIAYAGLGRKEEAIKEGLKATTLLPVSKDAIYGLGSVQDLAIIYTRLGEFDLAVEQLDKLLSIPSWISPVWLSWYIPFAPLKSDPRFNKLLADHPAENQQN